MKISQLALAAALAAVWAALPPAVRAHENDGEEAGGEMHKNGRPDERRDQDAKDRRAPDPEMKAKLEALRDLEKRTRDLSRRMRAGTDAEKAAAKAEARKVLGEIFDTRLAMETAMLARLEKHVAELKDKIARKKSSRDKMIDSRLSRLAGDGDDWE